MLFQKADVLGHRRLCDIQFFRCPCEIHALADRQKCFHPEIKHVLLPLSLRLPAKIRQQCRSTHSQYEKYETPLKIPDRAFPQKPSGKAAAYEWMPAD